jgi:hypothetical protein
MDEVESHEVDALPAPFSLAQQSVGIVFSIAEFTRLHRIPSLANVTVGNKACTFTVGEKTT